MSKEDRNNDINDYVNGVQFGILAYVRADGTPVQRRFGSFVKNEQNIFFSTRPDSAKVQELQNHPRVSFLFEADGQTLAQWKSVLVIGNAAPVTDDRERKQAVDSLSARNPRFRERVAKEGLKDTKIFALRASEIEVLDYTKGVGHSEKISLAKADQ